MLKVPQLDDLTYEQIVNRAVSRIPSMTDQWTDFNSHDPGITVLQTYAWLTDMLNYYMNATGDVHVQKYLKLLGIEPKPAHAAESYVILENVTDTVTLSKGTTFYAGDIPFELEENQSYSDNRFCSYIQECDGTGMDLTAFAGADGEYIEVFAENFNDQSVAYFGFQKALKNLDKLYVTVCEEEKRNAFGTDFKFSEIQWEYYTKDGWKALNVEDETCGFLKSGFITVHFDEGMESFNHPDSFEKAFYIRGILNDNQYDCMPKIGRIYVNPMKVVQKSTICQNGEMLPHLQIGSTNGCANQEVVFDFPDVYQFSLMLFADEDHLDDAEIWTMVDHIEEADYKDKVFSYDREKKCVCFGDGIHGMVPVQNQRICVTGLEISEFEKGNVLAGEISRTDCAELTGVKIYNPVASKGGCMVEELPEMLKRMEETLFVQNRMASEEDYEKIVLSTPGLMLDFAHVIPGYVYGDLYRQDRSANEVMVVVKPYSKKVSPKLSETYRKMIEGYIEDYRLINTKVTVVSPAYVGIEVYGRIVLNEDSKETRKRVMERIRELIDYQKQERPFGNVISYGKVFTALEAMDEIKMIRELSLEKNGSAAYKNDRGDILCQEDALSYVERMNIEFY